MASKIQSQPKPHIQAMLALQLKEQNAFAFDIYAARLVKGSRCLQVAMRERSLSISHEGPKFHSYRPNTWEHVQGLYKSMRMTLRLCLKLLKNLDDCKLERAKRVVLKRRVAKF